MEHFDDGRKLRVDFGGSWKGSDTLLIRGNIGTFGSGILFTTSFPEQGVEEDDMPDGGILHINAHWASSVDRFELTDGNRTLMLMTGEMGKPAEALNNCTRDLIQHWGLDVEAHRNSRTAPVLKNPNQVTRTVVDRILSKIDPNKSGAYYSLTLTVETDGKASHCILHQATTAKIDPKPVCAAAIRRARFEPAVDVNGNPMRSYHSLKVGFARI